MWALCAARVSLVSLGMAYASICSLSAPSSVRWSKVTLVIFVPAKVSCTCMGPCWVLATVPVTVRAAAEAVAFAPWAALAAWPAVELVALDAPVDGAGMPAGAAEDAGAASECVLNESSAASPAAVVPRTMTARRIGEPPGRGSRTEVDGPAGEAHARHAALAH